MHLHNWDKWKIIETKKVYYDLHGPNEEYQYSQLIQGRECKSCGLIRTKKVRID